MPDLRYAVPYRHPEQIVVASLIEDQIRNTMDVYLDRDGKERIANEGPVKHMRVDGNLYLKRLFQRDAEEVYEMMMEAVRDPQLRYDKPDVWAKLIKFHHDTQIKLNTLSQLQSITDDARQLTGRELEEIALSFRDEMKGRVIEHEG